MVHTCVMRATPIKTSPLYLHLIYKRQVPTGIYFRTTKRMVIPKFVQGYQPLERNLQLTYMSVFSIG